MNLNFTFTWSPFVAASDEKTLKKHVKRMRKGLKNGMGTDQQQVPKQSKVNWFVGKAKLTQPTHYMRLRGTKSPVNGKLPVGLMMGSGLTKAFAYQV